MTYDLFIFAFAIYAAFILLLGRCTGFNELGANEDLARRSGQPRTPQPARRAALAARTRDTLRDPRSPV